VPFSTGPYGCIGKNLAYMEIRTLAAMLIEEFDVALAPGEDGTELLHSIDHFTIGLKPLKMILTRRKTRGWRVNKAWRTSGAIGQSFVNKDPIIKVNGIP
jgi:hypothetical protein